MELTFHFFFHNANFLPEKLTEGRESLYLQHFYDRLVSRSEDSGKGMSAQLIFLRPFIDMESLLPQCRRERRVC